ncbi:MAG: ABC transporter permease [Chloroflexota bacterium]|nr:ABC transporter permease [Chloroflexota bacterium]
MALGKLWTIAWRDLGRNKRRSLFSILAVALGLALLIVLNGFIAGMVEGALQNSIRLETGHVQLRAASYEEEKTSLQWKDLLDNPQGLTEQANAMDEVKIAAPVLWASGYLNTRDEAVGIRIFGVDTTSGLYQPFREAMVEGEFLDADDRSGILIGKRLADSLELGVGDTVNLAVINSDGQPDESPFTIRGFYSTGVFSYDDSAAFMPLSKAQAFTNTGGRASAVTMLLNEQENAEAVAAALQSPGVSALTWRKLNEVFLVTLDAALSFYVIIYGIVILIVAVIIANTLLMAVFERIREVGILAALGMKGRQISLMFLIEAAILGVAGVLLGNILGSAGVAYLASSGISTGETGAVAADIAIGATMYAKFDPGGMFSLSAWTLIITLLAALYPAWYASRLEPVEALHSF